MLGTYSAKIVNTFTYEIRIVNVIVQSYGLFLGEELEVIITSLQRDSQATIDSFKLASQIFSKGIVIDVSNATFGAGTCNSAGLNCLGLSAYLRRRPQIIKALAFSWGKVIREYFFGKEALVVTVIFADGSTEKYKLVNIVSTETAFFPVPGSATAPGGSASSGAGGPISGYSGYASGGNIVVGGGGFGGGGSSCGYYWVQVARINGAIVSITVECY